MFDNSYEYAFPALRGIQAGREYYVAMCPLKIIPKIFLFDEAEIPPEIRAQRSLNESRVPEIARYITQNPDNYVFSALTASIDADARFEALGSTHAKNGVLHVSMTGNFLINDGQHRRAAIAEALKENPDLGDETIAVVFFLDRGPEHTQQMFVDLNKHAVRPSNSLNVLYDHRDPKAFVIREVVFHSAFFKDLVEMEHSNLVKRSRKLVTLSALHSATSALLANLGEETVQYNIELAASFWEAAASQFKEWKLVREGFVKSSEIRQDYLHTHGVILHALGMVGNYLMKYHRSQWKKYVSRLSDVDWSRANSEWEGRAMMLGRVKKSKQNITLCSNLIKQHLKLDLTAEEQAIENAFQNGRHTS
jgi:DNA sulfur modification protein DndB